MGERDDDCRASRGARTQRKARLARLLASAFVASLLAAPGAQAQRLDSYTVVRETIPTFSDLAKGLTVSCPEGTQVLSGGYRVLGLPTAGTRPQANRPTDDGTGWTVLVVRNALSSWGLEVTAVCGIVDHRVQISATTLESTQNTKTLEVDCTGDTRALGGGAEVAGDLGNVYLASWGVQGIFDSVGTYSTTTDSGAWSLTVYLICGAVPGYEIEFDSQQDGEAIKNLEAVCEPDRVPVGGGLGNGQVALANAAFSESTLSLDGQGWLGSIRDFGNDEFWTMSVRAVCAPEPDGAALSAAALAALAVLQRRRRAPR